MSVAQIGAGPAVSAGCNLRMNCRTIPARTSSLHPTRISGLGGMEATIIRFQVRAISVSVPGPPGRAMAASHAWTSSFRRSSRVWKAAFLLHPGVVPDASPAFDILTGHTDHVSAGLIRASGNGFHCSDVPAGQDGVPGQSQQSAEFVGFRIGCLAFLGL